MAEVKLYPNPIMPSASILFDEALCTGCNDCIDYCRTDVLMPNPEPGKPPIVAYPDECWFGGCCAGACKRKAIIMIHPMNQRAVWRRKETGKLYRVGANNGLKPNTKPAIVE